MKTQKENFLLLYICLTGFYVMSVGLKGAAIRHIGISASGRSATGWSDSKEAFFRVSLFCYARSRKACNDEFLTYQRLR